MCSSDLNADRRLAVQLPSWEEAVVLTHWRRENGVWLCEPGPMAEVEDTETTLTELVARCNKTIAFIKGYTPAQIDGSEEREIVLKMKHATMEFRGQQYLLNWVYPNFYFHVTTAYDILRHNGVEVGKMDYLGK